MRSSKNPRDDIAESVSNPSKITKNMIFIYKKMNPHLKFSMKNILGEELVNP